MLFDKERLAIPPACFAGATHGGLKEFGSQRFSRYA